MPKLKVNKDKCIGCGVCVSLYPHLFKIEGGKSMFIGSEDVKKEEAEKIIASCPMGAIEIEK